MSVATAEDFFKSSDTTDDGKELVKTANSMNISEYLQDEARLSTISNLLGLSQPGTIISTNGNSARIRLDNEKIVSVVYFEDRMIPDALSRVGEEALSSFTDDKPICLDNLVILVENKDKKLVDETTSMFEIGQLMGKWAKFSRLVGYLLTLFPPFSLTRVTFNHSIMYCYLVLNLT